MGFAFLGLLECAPRYGYTLKQDYDVWFGQGRSLKFGQVYATLSRLERHGYATVVVEPGEGPDRKRYAITTDGVDELESWLDSPVPADETTLGPLYTKVVVALVSGRPVEDVLGVQRSAHLARMRELRVRYQSAEVETQLALDFIVGHLQADLDWIELAGARLARKPPAS